LAADTKDTEWFRVWSNYGRDGKGGSAANTYKYKGFVCYVLRIWGTTDASVNKMIVFRDTEGVQREEDISTAEGYIQASKMNSLTRVYYFLYATLNGREVTEEETQAIFHEIVKGLGGAPRPPPKAESEACVMLFSECNFEGDSVKVCGDHPIIPEDMKQFRVKSVKVPDDVEVSFFKEE
jgi:hypothetical protein